MVNLWIKIHMISDIVGLIIAGIMFIFLAVVSIHAGITTRRDRRKKK